MRKEVRHMQRVASRGVGIRTIVALVAITASFLTTASVGGSAHGAPVKAAYFCPPAC